MSQPNLIDLTGQRFGRWLVLEQAEPGKGYSTRWLCQCDCGTIKTVDGQLLRSGRSKSCGCLGAEIQMCKPRSRGKAEEKLSAVLISIRRACENQLDGRYATFGAKGISVCDEWCKDENAFIEWSLNNGYQDGAILLRYDKGKSFTPWNCKWRTETDKGQGRKGSVIIVANEEAHSLAEWSRITGLHRDTILERLLKGATPEEAVDPSKKKKGRKGSKMLTANGETHSLAEWSRITGLHRSSIEERLMRGATPEEAVNTEKKVGIGQSR